MKSKIALLATIALVLFAGLMLSMNVQQVGMAAPVPAPTPVSAERTGVEPMDVIFFTAESVTADTTSTCAALANYERADIYYAVTIDGDNVNTTTLTLQHGNSPGALVDGIGVVSAVAATASDMQQVQLFGRYTCLKIDTTDASTGTVVVTANALVK